MKLYVACENNMMETVEHLFISCTVAKKCWETFAGAAGIQGPFAQLKHIIYKWWNVECTPKLKPIYKAIPAFIIWQIWKRRNMIKHGGKMSFHAMDMEINRNIIMFAQVRYPWLKGIPNNWPMLVKFFEEYTPIIECKVVYWKVPNVGSYKCNSDKSTKVNPGPSSNAFCIRDGVGDLIYAEASRIADGSILMAKVMALRIGLEYCISHNLLPVVLETDSLTLKKVLDGIWEVPWGLTMETKKI